jgi:hypothetical protein
MVRKLQLEVTEQASGCFSARRRNNIQVTIGVFAITGDNLEAMFRGAFHAPLLG